MITQQELIDKINKLKSFGTVDLSTEEDLSLAIMNLISLEEHFFFTAEKTGKDEYLDFVNQIREIRKSLLAKMMPENEGETWCIAKHLLAATMRLMEVGTKLQSQNEKTKAKEIFDKAYKLYNLFWGLRLKLISPQDLKARGNEQAWAKEDIVSKLVDCCKE